MADLFGSPNGAIAANQEQGQLYDRMLALGKYQQEVPHTQALTRLATAEASGMEEKQKQDQVLRQLMSGQGAPKTGPNGEAPVTDPATLIQQIEGRAQTLINAGFMKEGTELAGKASTMRQHASSITSNENRAATAKLEAKHKMLTEVNQLISGVTNEAQFEAAKATWMANHPESAPPATLRAYSPEMIQAVRNGTAEGLKRLDVEMRNQRLAQQEKAAKDMQESRKFQEGIAGARLKLARERESRIAKVAGAKGPQTGMPSRDLISAAEAQIAGDFPGLKATIPLGRDLMATQAAFDVASSAKAKMAANRALSASEALNQSYIEAKRSGAFKLEAGTKLFGFEVQAPKSNYAPGAGASADKPITIPKDKSVAPEVGKYYTNGTSVMQWTGKGWAPATGAGGAPAGSPEDDEEDMSGAEE